MKSSVVPVLTLAVLAVSGVVDCTSAATVRDYVGCFDPGYSLRQNYHHHTTAITLEKCFTLCEALHTRYAGVEASDNFCYCGNDIAEESIKRNTTLCKVRCPGEETSTCGGDWLMSLYDLGSVGRTPGGTGSGGSGNVSFLIGISVGVRLYNSANLDVVDTILTTEDWANTVDYHYSKNLVFVMSSRKIYRTTLDPKRSRSQPGANPTKVVSEVSSCDGFAVDWVHDRIYWADCSNNSNTIMSINLLGGDLTALLRRPEDPGMIKRMEIDPYVEMVFWTVDGIIESCFLSGNNFQTNMSDPGVNVRAFALDMPSRRIYYVGSLNQTVSLFSMDYQGGHRHEHFSLYQMRSVYGFGLLRGDLYWVNYANIKDVIYKMDLNRTSSVQTLKTIDRAVWHMRLVHPDLQKKPKRDPCDDRGCSDQCAIISPSTALCQCPEGKELDTDEVTCLELLKDTQVRGEREPAKAITVSVILVVAVVLISVGFLYLMDKYWSHVQTKLLGVPYIRKRDNERDSSVPPVYEYNITDDNVNLV